MSDASLNEGVAANDEDGAGKVSDDDDKGFVLPGHFIDEEQVEELRLLARAIGCVGKLLAIGDDPVERGDVEALFKVFEERLEGIMTSGLPVTNFAFGPGGRY